MQTEHSIQNSLYKRMAIKKKKSFIQSMITALVASYDSNPIVISLQETFPHEPPRAPASPCPSPPIIMLVEWTATVPSALR